MASEEALNEVLRAQRARGIKERAKWQKLREEDLAFGRKWESKDRALIDQGIREHQTLSTIARKLAHYAIQNARSWADKLANMRPHSIIICSFSATNAAKAIAISTEELENALLECIAADVLGTRPTGSGRGGMCSLRDGTLTIPTRITRRSLRLGRPLRLPVGTQ